MVGQTKPAHKEANGMTTTKIRTIIATLAATLTMGLTLVAAGPASAQPKEGSTPKGCPVEDEHGNTTYVEVGTRIGLFVCGADGEWHVGWLINGRVAPPKPTGPKGMPEAPVLSINRAP
jgi:hypothetical protein